jgi:hypothetical protein
MDPCSMVKEGRRKSLEKEAGEVGENLRRRHGEDQLNDFAIKWWK